MVKSGWTTWNVLGQRWNCITVNLVVGERTTVVTVRTQVFDAKMVRQAMLRQEFCIFHGETKDNMSVPLEKIKPLCGCFVPRNYHHSRPWVQAVPWNKLLSPVGGAVWQWKWLWLEHNSGGGQPHCWNNLCSQSNPQSKLKLQKLTAKPPQPQHSRDFRLQSICQQICQVRAN